MSKTIVVADDHARIRLLVRRTLAGPDYVILEARDGTEALALVRDEKPDLLILDWMMPGLTGMQVLDEIRADPDAASTPVIMLTAKAQVTDRHDAVLKGVRAYLTKPFSPLDLIDKVEKALKHPSAM